MARRYFTGFEVQGTPEAGFSANSSGSRQLTYIAPGRTGTGRRIRCTPSGSRTSDSANYWHATGGSISYGTSVFARGYFRKTGTPAAGKAIVLMRIHDSADGSDVSFVGARLNDDNTLNLVTYNANGTGALVTIGSKSSALADGVEYRIELMVKPLSAAHVDCELRLATGDAIATTVATAANQTVAGMDASDHTDWGRFGLYSGIGSAPASWVDTTNVTIDVDDVAINDDTVPTGHSAGDFGACDSYPGVGTIVTLLATTDDVVTGWTNGAGGSTGLWVAVSNDPPVGKASSSATASTQIKTPSTNVAGYTYQALLKTLAVLGVSDAPVVIQPVAILAGSSYNIDLLLQANPAVAAQNLTGGVTPGTYPTGWDVRLGQILHTPAIDRNTPTKATIAVHSGTIQDWSCYLAANLEVAPSTGRRLSMLV